MVPSLPGPGTRHGSVGRAFPHFETSIDNPDQNGDIQEKETVITDNFYRRG